MRSPAFVFFGALSLWMGCHVVAGLDGLLTGDEGAGGAQSSGGTTTTPSGGGSCLNDCCCAHQQPSCTGQAARFWTNDVPAGIGGAGGATPLPTTISSASSSSSSSSSTSGSSSSGMGSTSTSTGPTTTSTGPTSTSVGTTSTSSGPVACAQCVCDIMPVCCQIEWSSECVQIANQDCDCGCDLL